MQRFFRAGEDGTDRFPALDKVVQKIVVQFIRTEQTFRFLGNVAVFVRGQQFRRDGRRQHVFQDFSDFAARPVRIPVCHDPHQRFGNGAVDIIHGHVVAVVSGPAQRDLGEVAGPHHDPPLPVGGIHQDLGPFPRLNVLIGHTQICRIVPDIFKMLQTGFGDVHGPQIAAQQFGELFRVAFCPVGRPETGHGDGNQPVRRPAETPDRLCRHQDRQGGVQSTGDADDRFLGKTRLQTPQQPGDLDVEDLFAVLLPVRRDKGQGGACSVKRNFRKIRKFDPELCRIFADICIDDLTFPAEPFAFRKEFAVLPDHGVSIVNFIRGGFINPRRGKDGNAGSTGKILFPESDSARSRRIRSREQGQRRTFCLSGRVEYGSDRSALKFFCNGLCCQLRRFLQLRHQKEIAAGGTGDGKFRKKDQFCAVRCGFPGQADDLRGVVWNIRHFQLRDGGGNAVFLVHIQFLRYFLPKRCSISFKEMFRTVGRPWGQEKGSSHLPSSRIRASHSSSVSLSCALTAALQAAVAMAWT